MNKKVVAYSHNRYVILQLSTNVALVALLAVSILFRLDRDDSDYIIQYRSSLGLSPFERGDVTDIFAFVLFGIGVTIFSWYLSQRFYALKAGYGHALLGLNALLLVCAIIVSSSLLGL